MKKMIAAVSALAFLATPVAAVAAPAAQSLSVARAAAPTAEKSELAGASIVPIIILVGIVAGAIYLVVDDDNDSDSN